MANALKGVQDDIRRLQDALAQAHAKEEALLPVVAPEPDGEWATTLDFVTAGNGFRWGASVTGIERGVVHVTLPVTREGGSGGGTGGSVHGGFLAALVDMAGVSAALTRSVTYVSYISLISF